MYRRKLSGYKSRKMFRHGANRIHRKNDMSSPISRGGIKL